MKEVKITRSDRLVERLAALHVRLEGEAIVSDSKPTRKGNKKYNNLLLTDIRFIFNNKIYIIEHCWLQEVDYMYTSTLDIRDLNSKVNIKFDFYKYRDKITTGQHGMNIYGSKVIKKNR